MAYYNGKKVLSVVQVKEVEVDYYVGVATLENEKQDTFVVPQNIKVNNTNFPILDGTKTSVVEIGGNSVSFNQLVSDTQIFYSGSVLSVDYNNTTHQYTFKTNSTDWAVSNANNFTWINGHKYLVKINLISKTENAKLRLRYPTIISETSIITPTENLNLFGVQIQSTDGNEATIIFTINVFDLTLMGLDNITSVDEFKALFPLDYYPYNAGEIKSTIVSKIESWGANLFNTNTEVGTLSGYSKTTPRTFEDGKYYIGLSADNYYSPSSVEDYSISTNSITINTKSTGYGVTKIIKADPNTEYSLSMKIEGDTYSSIVDRIGIGFYDSDGNWLSLKASTTFTTPANCAWIAIVLKPRQAIKTTYSDIMLVRGSTAMDYKPYVGKLGQINIPNAPLKLDGVNDIHNTLAFEEQSDGSYNAIVTRKFGIVDLGELNYTYYAPSDAYPYGFFVANIVGKKNNSNNLLCKEYSVISSQPFTHDKNMVTTSTNGVYIVDSSYTDATSFKTAKSGVKLYYELATPTNETIATGLAFDQVATLFEKGGTLEIDNSESDYIQTNSTMAFAVRRFRTTEE